MVIFRIEGATAPETAIWFDGHHERLDLTATAGTDLAVTKSDAVETTSPGDVLTYTLSVTNLGPVDATGVTVNDPLPENTAFVSASDGATPSDGAITWPSTSRWAKPQPARSPWKWPGRSPPARSRSSTPHQCADGTDGVDPVPSNNTAIDAPTGGPDLVVQKNTDLEATLYHALSDLPEREFTHRGHTFSAIRLAQHSPI